MRIAESCESSNFRTHLALPGIPGSMLYRVSVGPSPPFPPGRGRRRLLATSLRRGDESSTRDTNRRDRRLPLRLVMKVARIRIM